MLDAVKTIQSQWQEDQKTLSLNYFPKGREIIRPMKGKKQPKGIGGQTVQSHVSDWIRAPEWWASRLTAGGERWTLCL